MASVRNVITAVSTTIVRVCLACSALKLVAVPLHADVGMFMAGVVQLFKLLVGQLPKLAVRHRHKPEAMT